jgi:hypothetical protein
MRARCWRHLVLERRSEFRRRLGGIAFVVETLIALIRPERAAKRARRRRIVLNDDDLQAERAEYGLEAGWPYPFFAWDGVVIETMSAVRAGVGAKSSCIKKC